MARLNSDKLNFVRWCGLFIRLASTRQGRGRLLKAKSAEVSPPSRVLEARVGFISIKSLYNITKEFR